jgi:demethylmenaquinone methyltransferase/2-methoxy-6-polyprenyl-1,4-benzoquinol methylase
MPSTRSKPRKSPRRRSGTGDLALEIHRRTAGARSRGGLHVRDARSARQFRSAGAAIPRANADGLHPLPVGSFQGATAAFSVRNFENTAAGLREIRRVLAPGGRFVILEFTPEPTGPLAPLVLFHVRRVVPVLGRLVSGDTGAYSYLPDSVSQWPAPAALAAKLKEAGFSEATWTPLIFGIAAIHVARV